MCTGLSPEWLSLVLCTLALGCASVEVSSVFAPGWKAEWPGACKGSFYWKGWYSVLTMLIAPSLYKHRASQVSAIIIAFLACKVDRCSETNVKCFLSNMWYEFQPVNAEVLAGKPAGEMQAPKALTLKQIKSWETGKLQDVQSATSHWKNSSRPMPRSLRPRCFMSLNWMFHQVWLLMNEIKWNESFHSSSLASLASSFVPPLSLCICTKVPPQTSILASAALITCLRVQGLILEVPSKLTPLSHFNSVTLWFGLGECLGGKDGSRARPKCGSALSAPTI